MPDCRLDRTRRAYVPTVVPPARPGEVPHDWFYDIQRDEYVCRRCGERTPTWAAVSTICEKES